LVGWLSILKTVPWADVIRSAPTVADGAKKLWGAVSKQSPSPHAPAETLQAQVVALENTVAELHSQMLASTELIKALAEQNTQLIKRIETNRLRLLWLLGAAIVAGVMAVASLILTLVR